MYKCGPMRHLGAAENEHPCHNLRAARHCDRGSQRHHHQAGSPDLSSPAGVGLCRAGLSGQPRRWISLLNHLVFPTVAALPEAVDLAVLCTPAHTAPGLVRECGERGRCECCGAGGRLWRSGTRGCRAGAGTAEGGEGNRSAHWWGPIPREFSILPLGLNLIGARGSSPRRTRTPCAVGEHCARPDDAYHGPHGIGHFDLLRPRQRKRCGVRRGYAVSGRPPRHPRHSLPPGGMPRSTRISGSGCSGDTPEAGRCHQGRTHTGGGPMQLFHIQAPSPVPTIVCTRDLPRPALSRSPAADELLEVAATLASPAMEGTQHPGRQPDPAGTCTCQQ